MTPEPVSIFIANHFLDKVKDVIIVDGCCGVGGNLIQFALHKNVKKAYGVDMDKESTEFAQHNSKIYGVDQNKI